LCSSAITIAGGRELSRKIKDVAHRCGPEPIDRLSVIANGRKPRAIGCQHQKNICLQPVGVLIFVDEDVVESRAHLCGDGGNPGGFAPVKQQIIVIEHVVLLFGSDITSKKPLQLGFPFVAPRVEIRQRLCERAAGVDGVGVDRQTGALLWKSQSGTGEAEIVAHDIHQIRTVGAVEHGEGGVQRERSSILAQQSVADRMKGARPG